MSLQIASWEHTLLSWAYEALDHLHHAPAEPLVVSPQALDRAYAHCAQISKANSRTFHLASGLLPAGKKRSVRALYAFCRVSDDLVDRNRTSDPHAALQEWRQRVMLPPAEEDAVTLAWADARLRHRIPVRYVQQLLDGVARDLQETRYASFEDLAAYCYGVASTVGLMVMHIVGFEGPEAIHYAVRLGVALQLTNILRDVGEDRRVGRLYLPLDELADFGVSPSDIDEGRTDERWRRFMRFQIARTRRLYAQARPGIAMLSRDARFAIGAATTLYEAILEDIEAHDMDVFSRRARIGTAGKLSRLPGIWRRTALL